MPENESFYDPSMDQFPDSDLPSSEGKSRMDQQMGGSSIGRVDGAENVHRFERLAAELPPGELSTLESLLKDREGDPNNLFDPHGRVLHTTNSHSFERMLADGRIREGRGGGGMYGTSGVSFTDGDSELALTFQTLYDEQNSRSGEKRLHSGILRNQVDGLVSYFWDHPERQNEFKAYLATITSGAPPESKEDAIRMAERFKYQATPRDIADNPTALAELYGITISYTKDALPELSQEGTQGIQRVFELRSHRPEGVPIAEAESILVPLSQVEHIKERLHSFGLEKIQVRPSEELEARRMFELVGEGKAKTVSA